MNTAPGSSMDRTWTIGNRALRAEEQGRVLAVLAGVALTGQYPMMTLSKKLELDERDVVYLLPSRLLIVAPTPASRLKLRDGVRGLSDVSRLAAVLSVERVDVCEIRCPAESPPMVRLLDGVYARFDVAHHGGDGCVDFWVDTSITPAERFGTIAKAWIVPPPSVEHVKSLDVLADDAVDVLELYFSGGMHEPLSSVGAQFFELISLRFSRLGKSPLLQRLGDPGIRTTLAESLEADMVDDVSFRAAVRQAVTAFGTVRGA